MRKPRLSNSHEFHKSVQLDRKPSQIFWLWTQHSSLQSARCELAPSGIVTRGLFQKRGKVPKSSSLLWELLSEIRARNCGQRGGRFRGLTLSGPEQPWKARAGTSQGRIVQWHCQRHVHHLWQWKWTRPKEEVMAQWNSPLLSAWGHDEPSPPAISAHSSQNSSERGFQMTRPAAPERKLSGLQYGGCWASARLLKESKWWHSSGGRGSWHCEISSGEKAGSSHNEAATKLGHQRRILGSLLAKKQVPHLEFGTIGLSNLVQMHCFCFWSNKFL